MPVVVGVDLFVVDARSAIHDAVDQELVFSLNPRRLLIFAGPVQRRTATFWLFHRGKLCFVGGDSGQSTKQPFVILSDVQILFVAECTNTVSLRFREIPRSVHIDRWANPLQSLTVFA